MMDAYQAAEFQYRMTQLLEAQITLEGMKAANDLRKLNGESPAYGENHFTQVIHEYGIHHNAAVEAGLKIKNGG